MIELLDDLVASYHQTGNLFKKAKLGAGELTQQACMLLQRTCVRSQLPHSGSQWSEPLWEPYFQGIQYPHLVWGAAYTCYTDIHAGKIAIPT